MGVPRSKGGAARLAALLVLVGSDLTAAQPIGTEGPAPPSPSPVSVCAAVVQCQADEGCNRCLDAVASSGLPPLLKSTTSEKGRVEKRFFRAVVATPGCTTTPLFDPALEAAGACGLGDYNTCQRTELQCAGSPACAQCLAQLYEADAATADVLRSAACNQTNPTVVRSLADTCWSYPSCTLAKVECTGTCATCWTLLREGQGRAAARACSTTPSAVVVDSLVSNCLQKTAVSCSFWLERCAQDAVCQACLLAMESFTSVDGVIRGSQTPACLAAAGTAAETTLSHVIWWCPVTQMSPCYVSTFECVFSQTGQMCAQCLSGSTNSPQCAAMIEHHGIGPACKVCSSTVDTINKIVLATSVVGSVSVVACLGVALAILASGKHQHSMRERILLGLMLANAVYSSANAIPLYRLQTGEHCGQLVLSYADIRFGRAWWLAGKYSIVLYELFILSASTWAMRRGVQALPRSAEVALHTLCLVGGVASFTAFYLLCAKINEDGYNAATQKATLADAVDHTSVADDLDDDDSPAAGRYLTARADYDELVQRMLQVWCGLLGVAILIWLRLRHTAWMMRRLWWTHLFEAEQQWNRDLWHPNQQGERAAKLRVQILIKEAFEELVQPLEKFVLVFVVFGIPAVVMSTDYCQEDSGANLGWYQAATQGSNELSYGLCDVWCELSLAFRSLATVIVYVSRHEHRADIFRLRRLWLRLLARCGRRRTGGARVRFDDQRLEQVRFINSGGQDVAAVDSGSRDADHISEEPYSAFTETTAERSFESSQS